jgi:hypothetical protein
MPEAGGPIMRVLFGIILGVILTIGVAFISDSWTNGPATSGSLEPGMVEHRTMVNWDVVGDNVRIVSQRAREAWSKLSHMVSG